MRLLVTGFPPFPGRPENPSEGLVRAIQMRAITIEGECHSALLPVEYAGVETAFDLLVRQIEPTHWVAFGVGRQNCPLRLERRGLNRDHASIPDNSGELRIERVIEPDGPPFRDLQHNYQSLVTLLAQAGLPAEENNDAGAYICNHLLYYAQKRLAEPEQYCEFMFVHLAPPEFGLPLEKLLFALQIIVDWFQNQPAHPFAPKPLIA